MAYYRLINNKKVSTEAIISGFTKATCERIEPVHYLCFQDTTQVNLESNRGRIRPNSGLGLIADNKSLGFYLHPSLVMKASNESCIGFSFIKPYIHVQGGANRHERNYNYLPIQEKESYRWIQCVQQSSKTLSNASMRTYVQDREGDIFELLASHTDKDFFIIRSTYNRKVSYGEQICGLYETLASSVLGDTYRLDVRGDIRKNTLNRQALMELRFIEVEVQPPLRHSKTTSISPVKVVAIEAKESPSSVPDGQEPIHWRILTTHQVNDFSDACQIVYWYSLRWHIETLFRLLKTQGFDIESIGLENGEAIIKMTLFALWASLKVMALLLSSKTIFPNQNQAVNELFTESEIECLKVLNVKFSGNTPGGVPQKLKNPYPDTALSWAFWVIARLGGWKGYNSQRPPGVIILYKGIKKFELILMGYELQRCV